MTDLPKPEAEFDPAKAEAFAGKMGETITAGAVTVMTSIGHRSGLFDVMAQLPPSSSMQIADAAELAERYVREWLATMVVAGIVTYDPEQKHYSLPPEHAACLTRGAPLGNVAVYAQFVAMGGSVQDRILQCFETGEGTAYDEYPCFHAIMAEDSEMSVVASLFETVLPLVDGLNKRLETGIDVLDAGCGSGRALIALAERYPNSRFTGYDFSDAALAGARRVSTQAGLENIRFDVKDMTGFDETGRYDLVTSFDAVHDQKHPDRLIAALHRALRPGGVYLMQDIGGSAHLEKNADFPMAAFLYAMSCLHCMPVSIGQDGDGLGTMWGWETARDMLRETGFAQVERHVLPHDPMNVWFVSQRG
jgi:SAM-dependent methyltransferase